MSVEEVDFTPLPGRAEVGTELRVLAKGEDGAVFDQEYVVGGLKPASIRAMVAKQMEEVGWKVKLGVDYKMIVTGHKDKGLANLEIKATGLLDANKPIITPLKKQKK